MKYKIAIADAFRLGELDFKLEKGLLSHYDCELFIYNCHTEDDLIESIKDAHIILTVAALFSEKVINQLENCQSIIRYGIGIDSIDLGAATKHHIVVCNEPEYCVEDVALHTVVLILNLIRKIGLFDKVVRKGNWSFQSGYTAHRPQDKIVGLIGFGNIAKKVVQYLEVHGIKFIVFDPYIDHKEGEEYGVLISPTLEELLIQADFVSIHCPLTSSTKHLISYKEFDIMSKDAFLINTARGPIIHYEALIDALEKGKIAGAGLDVFEHEPLQSNDPLCAFDNVILTPHAAFYTEESFHQLRTSVIQQAVSVIKGLKPTYAIN